MNKHGSCLHDRMKKNNYLKIWVEVCLIENMKVMKKRSKLKSQNNTEITLKESEPRFRTIMMSVGDGVIVTDAEGRVEIMNPVAEELTGWKKEEAHGKLMEEVFHIINEETRQIVENPVIRVIREGIIVGLANHSVLIAKDGTEYPIADSGSPIRDEKNDITGVVLVFRDQARERMAQKALQESERKFRETMKYLDEGFYSVTPDGLLLDHNQAFNQILGIDISLDMKGARLPDFWQNPDERKAYLDELITRGFIRNYLINAKTTGGEKIVVMANSHLLKDAKGNLVRIEGTFTDFTERRRAEEQLGNFSKELEQKINERTKELQRSKKLLDETGRLARVGGWEIDIKANTLYWSEMTYKIHEVDPGFVPNVETGINFYAPEAIPVISQCVDKAIRLGEPFDVELELITAKKNRIWVRAIGEAYRENGEITKIGGVFQDINTQKLINDELRKYRDHLEEMVNERTKELDQANSDLKRSNQELEQFAYVASHDLQEPLRMVSSYTQLLEKRYKDQLDQDAKDFINFAVDGANRMQRLINDLLDYSRITSRGKPFLKIDLSVVLGQALANLQNKIQETGSLIVNDDLPFAYGDEGQLIRVFQNLLDNAIKFGDESPPRINITSQTINEKVQISISDNGIGIDKIYTERVFTIFQRLHNKVDYPGTGIGLAICKRTIERHGGTIWFESEPGKGTTFFFTLNIK
jgi:PAS domain S-box-containing protein